MIEECERPGWVTECPNCKYQFNSTLLKSWGGQWIVFYSSDGNYLYFELLHYRIVYLKSETEVYIIRIRHTKMEPKRY